MTATCIVTMSQAMEPRTVCIATGRDTDGTKHGPHDIGR